MSGPFPAARVHPAWAWQLLLACTLLLGCGPALDSKDHTDYDTVAATATSVRAQRRMYNGAPPVIPHPPLKIACLECHTAEGKATPPLGVAPANPHGQTEGIGPTGICTQCHVFQAEVAPFTENDFACLVRNTAQGERLYLGAPPVVPHPAFMREDCTACHAGPAARVEVRCTHPSRSNCRQCHAASPAASTTAELGWIP